MAQDARPTTQLLVESKHDHAISIEKTMIPVATIFEGILAIFELLILWGSVLTDEAVFACPSGTSIPFRLERKTVPCKVAPDASPVLTDEAVFACPSGISIFFRLERKTVPCKVALDVATTVEGILVTFFELLVS